MLFFFFFSSRRRHTSCALVTGVQTCALPIYSAYAELNAPIFDQLEVNASGRYDRYSGGLDNFSPKIGVKVKPIKEVLLRGTYSRGFRVPSFGEANATFPTTGFVTNNQSLFNDTRSEAHTSEIQSLMRNSNAVFCLNKK